MFKDVGGKIKVAAEIMCILMIIGSIIGAIILGQIKVWQNHSYVYPYAGLAWGVFLGGIVTAFISAWLLYGFGALVENSELQANQNAEILRLLNQTNGNMNGSPKSTSEHKTSSSSFHLTSSSATSGKSPWKCRNCGTDNPGAASSCQGCGERRP